MDQKDFDALTRLAAGSRSRRDVAKALGAGALGSAFGLLGRRAGAEEIAEPVAVEAETCRSTGSNCDGDAKCCSQRCSGGTCQCRNQGANCVIDGRRRDKACCSGRCKRNGKCS